MVTSTGTFVSCKDYDDDIDQINKELTDIKSAISELQTKVGAGKFVTNIAKEGDGIKITWNDNTTNTIETIKGDKGDKTLVTIVDGYWAFDGVKSDYPAKGDKGEDGAAAAAGHDAKISEDGYWMVWDATQNNGTGAYVKTEYIAGGATAVAGEHGWTINVRDDKGQMQSIYIPNSADLVSIEAAKGETGFSYNIYYGILKTAKDWKGAKAVDGKMEAGMYPTLDRNVDVLLNPVSVDATAYRFDFRGSDNKELWGLKFGDIVPYSSAKLTRAASSASGLWTLPRIIQRVTLENYQDRPDYVTQFKSNDGQYYAFAMNAVSKDDDSKVVKSQYLYKFTPYNVSSVDELKGSFTKKNYTWNVAHKPNFAASWKSGNTTVTGQVIEADSALIYDYWLEIDRDQMSQTTVDKYGLEIVNDKYEFIAKNAAAVDNSIYLKFHYILINGNEGVKAIEATIIEKDIEVASSNIGSINAKFNAEKLTLTGKEALPVNLNGKYVYSAEVLSFDLAEKLGANKDQWIDAMYKGLKDKVSNKDKSDFLKDAAILTGGDPINNVTYNAGLLNNFVYFDYVDKDGKSCIYNTDKEDNTKLLSRIESIAGLKVYFIAGTYKQNAIVNNAPVQAPYYTEDGTANWDSWNNGYALPLDNAFRVQLFTSKEQQTVAALDFSFELTMPDNCPIKRETVGNQTSKWNDKQNALTIYGQKYGDLVNVDMRDAFVGAFKLKDAEKTEYYNYAHAYGEMKPEAEWYKITWSPVTTSPIDEAVFIDMNLMSRRVLATTLGEIANTAEYAKWNTYGNIAGVFAMNGLKASENRPTYKTEAVEYDHFGVYREGLSNFTVKFASKVEDSQKAGLNSGLDLKEAATIEAKAVYKADKVTVDYYTFSVSNATFTMTDAFDNAYYLFDNGTVVRAGLHIKLNEATQGIISRDIEKEYFGLYPIVRVDDKIVFTSLPAIVPADAAATPVEVEFIQSADKAYTTGMTFKIPGAEGQYANDKKFEITFNVTDVFGTVKPFTFYARTVNVAIGNDNKPVGE